VRSGGLRFIAGAALLVALWGCGSTHSASNEQSLAAWGAYHRPLLAGLEQIAQRGSAATQAHDFQTLGSVCRDGAALIAKAKAGPVAPDVELQLHYSLMETAYGAGFSTCADGTEAGAGRSLTTLARGNQELTASTARLMKLAQR
jgi:hypothetical protein